MTTITAITRLCLLAALASLLLLTAGCGGSGTDGDAALPTVTTRQQGAFLLTLSTPRAVYDVGETVPFTLAVTNTGTEPITFVYTSPNEVNMRVSSRDTGEVVYFEQGEGGIVSPRETTYAPGRSRTFEFSWNQKTGVWLEESNEIAVIQVAPGQYALEIALRAGTNGYESKSELPAAPLAIRIDD